MIRYKISHDLYDRSRDYVNNHNLACRGSHDATKHQQLTGTLGEFSVIECMGLPIIEKEQRGDRGIDFILEGYQFDVKTMATNVRIPKPFFIHHVGAMQKLWSTHAYVFCHYNVPHNYVTICGFIPVSMFYEKALFVPIGTKVFRRNKKYILTPYDDYTIRNDQLFDVNTPKDLLDMPKRLRSMGIKCA